MSIPFLVNNNVLFEVSDNVVCLGDLSNAPARYCLENLTPGLYMFPADAIRQATCGDEKSFSVDGGFIFVASAEPYQRLVELFSDGTVIIPDESWLQNVRNSLGYAFGFVGGANFESYSFNGDGSYVFDPSMIRPTDLVDEQSRKSSRDILEGALKGMNTLVCSKCFQNELNSHPDLGMFPRKAADNKVWVQKMVELAINQGWTGAIVPSAFGDFSINCPKCSGSQHINAET